MTARSIEEKATRIIFTRESPILLFRFNEMSGRELNGAHRASISYFSSPPDPSLPSGDGLTSKLVKTTGTQAKRYSAVHVYRSRKVLEPDTKCKAFLAYSAHVSIFIIHHLVGS